VSQEEILKILRNLGLKKTEAKTYFYLAKRGPKKAKEITKALKITKQRLYPILKNLENKAIVKATLDRPAKFYAVPFEKVLDLFAKAKFEEAKIIQQNKGKLLSDWESIRLPKDKDVSAKFAIIKGRNYIYSKIQQMIEETTNQFSMLSDFSGLLRAEQFGVLDSIRNHPLKSEIEFRVITEVSKNHLGIMKELLISLDSSIMIKGRNADVGLPLFPRMIIRDNQEILYFISRQTREPEDQHDFVGILTDCTSLVKPFSSLFEELWKNSTDIQQKILEIETGILPQRTLIIEEPDIALAKYNEVLKNAQKNIIMIASSKEILLYRKNPSLLKELTKTGVKIKIMAPISRENLKACLDLLEFCEVRHIPNEYMKTIIIDEKHLFQFKLPESQIKDEIAAVSSKQTVYSNDFEYVEKTKKMLLDIWKKSVIPSAVTAGSIIEQQLSSSDHLFAKKSKDKFVDVVYTSGQFYKNPQTNKITVKDVISKIEAYKKGTKSVDNQNTVLCGALGYALIRSHNNFNYPDMFIIAYDIDEESTFGAENALVISLEMKALSGLKYYIPVTIIGDNPKATNGWKRDLAGLPAKNNYHLFKRDELHIQTLGNTLFVGWTKPIPLLSNQKPLPPSALLLEATGKIQSRSYEMTLSSGLNQKQRFNYSDAFVTFIHQKTKYQGPSTDGTFVRDIYLEDLLNAHHKS
jgi:sugar-specific transcriptional regulator TrmB